MISVALVASLTGLIWPAGAAHAEPPCDQQWYLDQIAVPQAHQMSQGEGVVIGMFADGVLADHPALRGQVGTGVHLGTGGRLAPPAATDDPTGAGTALAGLMVARGGGHPLGVAPKATVLAVTGAVGSTQVDRGLHWLVDHRATVIDLSIGAGVRALETGFDGIRYALAHDVVVVMGREHAAAMTSVSKDGVLVVGGVDEQGARPATAPLDGWLALTAPGTLAMFTVDGRPDRPADQGRILVGADAGASAIVAGVAALVRARHPELNAASVIQRLLRTARDTGDPGRDGRFGFGIVDPVAALTAPVPAVDANPLGDPGPPAASRPAGLLAGSRRAALAVAGLFLPLVVAVALAGRLIVRRRRAGHR